MYDNPLIAIQAMKHLSGLHEDLCEAGYAEKERETMMVRLLFCFFAAATEVFSGQKFYELFERTEQDGRTISGRLSELFRIFDTPEPERTETDRVWKDFPYLGSELFADRLPERQLPEDFRDRILACRLIPWQDISPAIFGAMFQEVMNQEKRREWGTYYYV